MLDGAPQVAQLAQVENRIILRQQQRQQRAAGATGAADCDKPDHRKKPVYITSLAANYPYTA